MKLNYEIALRGKKVVLAPYRPEHVLRYHEWMKDPDLLEATGSEPLSLDEEWEMQQSWRDDPNKCTFIVHSIQTGLVDDDEKEVSTIETFTVSDHLGSMVGDVNMFLSEIDIDEEEAGEAASNGETPRIQAEIDIMIAEKKYQTKGLGRSATCAMLIYGSNELRIERYFCKINEGNEASIHLFKSLGFVQCDYAACFKQFEFELIMPTYELVALLEPHGSYVVAPCPV